jgi:hypothetical protein
MPQLIALAVVCVLLYHFWQYVLGAVAVIGIIWFAFDQNKKSNIAAQEAEAKRLRLLREEEARVAAHKAAQQNFKTELVKVTGTSLQTFEALPVNLLQAESLLDQAEQDFKEGAFAPFWDSIEQATIRLGSFNSGIASINHNLKRHGELSKLYEEKSPRFPIVIDSVKGMIAGNTTGDRMKTIVRQAQRNFQFASIYEQRKTNQILIAGFTNLAQALDGMGRRISESIDELSTQVSEMSSSLNESMENLGEQMATVNRTVSESVQDLHSTFQKESKDQADRHDRALEMLDNIQRRRMPTGFHLGVGTKPAP